MSVSNLQSQLESCLLQVTTSARCAREIVHKSPACEESKQAELTLNRLTSILQSAVDILSPLSQRVAALQAHNGTPCLLHMNSGQFYDLTNPHERLAMQDEVEDFRKLKPVLVLTWDENQQPKQWVEMTSAMSAKSPIRNL